jgi:hypothetical protein
VGSKQDDHVGSYLTPLPNGDYVVGSNPWDNGRTADAGAATSCSGTAGCAGAVSPSNSLVGGTSNDKVGCGPDYCTDGSLALHNGSYVVNSYRWRNGSASQAGAVTWCSGETGCIGAVSAGNSLIGSTAGDQVGSGVIWTLDTGDYVVGSPAWNNGAAAGAGAVTWCDGMQGCAGPVSASNSVLGTAAGGGAAMSLAFDYVHDQLIVGRPADHRVTLFRVGNHASYLPLITRE